MANGAKWRVGVGSGEAAKGRKRRIGEPESLMKKRLRAHFKREAALWEEHERTLAAELAVWRVKRAAFFTGEDVGRRG